MTNLSERHWKDLRNSGLEDEIIEEIGFYTCKAEEACKLLDRKDINCECLVIPYPNAPDFFRLKPDDSILGSDGKPAKYLQKSGTKPRIFTHPRVRELLNEKEEQLPILITEGEKKCLKATQEFFFNEPYLLPISFGGVWNWRTHRSVINEKTKETEYRKGVISDLEDLILLNKLVYICFDSDIVVNTQVADAESELATYLISRGVLKVASIRIPYTGEKEGLDDYLISKGNESFKELINSASSNHLIRNTIKAIRKLPNLTHIDKLDYIVGLIIKDQLSEGKFFVSNQLSYFFSNKNHKMFRVEEEQYAMTIADIYGLYRDTNEFNSVISKLQEYANFNGEKITVYNFAYFLSDSKRSIIYNNNGHVFSILPGDTIRIHSNGWENIFFHHKEYSEITYKPDSTGFFKKYLLDVCNFQQNENTLLTGEQQKTLFTIWFYSLFYPNLLPTKPILVMTGDYGSGKSTIQRLVGKLLFGNNFNVSTIQGERDFLTSVINKYYLVYDNVDINEEWVRNAIASLSTGFKVEVRKLYSNMEMYQADPIAYLAMNSMSQSIYKRPDVASRLLIFRTKRLQSLIPSHVLEKNLLDNRNEILSEVFDTLLGINRFVDDNYTYEGNFRMADFANLGYKIAMNFGLEYEFKLILDILSREQASLPLEDNPIIDLLDKWLVERKEIGYISTGDLFAALYKVASETKLTLPFKNSQGLGRALSMSMENLKTLFKIECRRGHGNKLMWWIENK